MERLDGNKHDLNKGEKLEYSEKSLRSGMDWKPNYLLHQIQRSLSHRWWMNAVHMEPWNHVIGINFTYVQCKDRKSIMSLP